MLREKVRDLLGEVRTEAVGIVDSFNKSDFTMRSALGRYDGKYMEALWEWAQREPANQKSVPEGFHEIIRPMLDAGQKRAKL